MSARPAITLADARAVELGPDPLDPGSIVSGAPVTSSAAIARSGDGAETGIWRCEPGVFTDTEAEETFVVLEGRATVEHEGAAHELVPGSVCVFTAGTETTWTVHETLLKVYVIEAA